MSRKRYFASAFASGIVAFLVAHPFQSFALGCGVALGLLVILDAIMAFWKEMTPRKPVGGTIVFWRVENGFMARQESDPSEVANGSTPQEAIGVLIWKYPERYGVSIK